VNPPQPTTTTLPSIGIANPASVKCEADGGTLRILDSPDGQYGICMFSDGSVCEEWAYFRGECSKGECMKHCGAIGSRSEGWYDCNNKLLWWENCAGGIQNEPFCGRSTEGTCAGDGDCAAGGCSGQVCGSLNEEPSITTCDYRDCYNAAKYNLSCKCLSGKCKWV